MNEILCIIGLIVGIGSIIKKVKGGLLISIFWVTAFAALELSLYTQCDLLIYIISSIATSSFFSWILVINITGKGVKNGICINK